MNCLADVVSSQECEAILNKFFGDKNFELVSFCTVPLSNNIEGLLGEHYILKTDVKRNEHVVRPSFFAKVPLRNLEYQFEFARASNAFEKEAFIYEELTNEFKIYCPSYDENIMPKCYLTRGNDLVVLENLQLQDFCVAPSEDTLDIKHIKLVLKVLAKLHSASIIYEERKAEELGKGFQLIDKYEEFLEEAFFRRDENYLGFKWHIASQKGLLSIIDKMPEMGIPNSEFKEKFCALTETCFDVVKPSNIFRNVLCHGDLNKRNFMYRYETNIPVECKLVDFQLMKYSPPAYDVLKLIYQTTTAEMRQHYFEDLLKYYYDHLCKELTIGGVDGSVLSCEQFRASVKYMLPQCKVETSYYFSFQKFGREFYKVLMYNHPEQFKVFGFCDRSSFMLEYYQDGSEYKKWMDEIMFDIKDMIVQHGFTREDCHAILKSKLNTTDYRLNNYEVKKVVKKSGFLGEQFKMHINLNTKIHSDHYFFLKRLPDTGLNSFAVQFGAFNNEKFMFDTVFKKMSLFGIEEIQKCVPKCYYSLPNDLLVFEDLDKGGFETANRFKPFDLEHISVVVKCLAYFHGSSLIMEEQLTKTNGEVFRIDNHYSKGLYETLYAKTKGHLGLNFISSGIKGIFTTIDLLPDPDSSITDNQFKHMIKNFYENSMYDLTSPSKKTRNVLCISDLWASNIMMKYDCGKLVDCRLVDYQCTRICPPASDVMALLYLTTTRKFRANFTCEVIDLYHKELTTILTTHGLDVEAIVPYSEFLESCEEYKVFAINQVATHFPIIMMEREDMKEIFADEEFCHRTLFIDRSEFVKNMFERDERYKFVVGESIKDLRILCENIAANKHD